MASTGRILRNVRLTIGTLFNVAMTRGPMVTPVRLRRCSVHTSPACSVVTPTRDGHGQGKVAFSTTSFINSEIVGKVESTHYHLVYTCKVTCLCYCYVHWILCLSPLFANPFNHVALLDPF